jgi:HTH-type transcriptional regulator / antitoxin HigA
MLTEIRPIRTDADHEAVVTEIWRLMEMEPEPGSPQGDRLEVLAMLSEAYEAKHHPVEPADPIDTIEFMMEQKGLERSDLEPALGQSGRVSEVLNRKRPLSINMIRGLVSLLDIPADILVRPYRLATDATTEYEKDTGALVYPFRKRTPRHRHGAANSNDRVRAAAKRATGATTKKSAAKKGAARKIAAATATKRSTRATAKRSQGTAAKRPSSSGSRRGSRPAGSKR